MTPRPSRSVPRCLPVSLVGLLLASVLAAAAVVVGVAAPASACSCASSTPREHVEHSDTVFVGVLADTDGAGLGRTAAYTFDVVEVLQGEAGPRAEVRSAADGAACGLEGMVEGESYVVFADDGQASLCGGTRSAGPSYVARVEAVTGAGRAPAEAGPAALEPRDGSEEVVTVVAVTAAAAILLGVAGLVLTRRARARGSRSSG